MSLDEEGHHEASMKTKELKRGSIRSLKVGAWQLGRGTSMDAPSINERQMYMPRKSLLSSARMSINSINAALLGKNEKIGSTTCFTYSTTLSNRDARLGHEAQRPLSRRLSARLIPEHPLVITTRFQDAAAGNTEKEAALGKKQKAEVVTKMTKEKRFRENFPDGIYIPLSGLKGKPQRVFQAQSASMMGDYGQYLPASSSTGVVYAATADRSQGAGMGADERAGADYGPYGEMAAAARKNKKMMMRTTAPTEKPTKNERWDQRDGGGWGKTADMRVRSAPSPRPARGPERAVSDKGYSGSTKGPGQRPDADQESWRSAPGQRPWPGQGPRPGKGPWDGPRPLPGQGPWSGQGPRESPEQGLTSGRAQGPGSMAQGPRQGAAGAVQRFTDVDIRQQRKDKRPELDGKYKSPDNNSKIRSYSDNEGALEISHGAKELPVGQRPLRQDRGEPVLISERRVQSLADDVSDARSFESRQADKKSCSKRQSIKANLSKQPSRDQSRPTKQGSVSSYTKERLLANLKHERQYKGRMDASKRQTAPVPANQRDLMGRPFLDNVPLIREPSLVSSARPEADKDKEVKALGAKTTLAVGGGGRRQKLSDSFSHEDMITQREGAERERDLTTSESPSASGVTEAMLETSRHRSASGSGSVAECEHEKDARWSQKTSRVDSGEDETRPAGADRGPPAAKRHTSSEVPNLQPSDMELRPGQELETTAESDASTIASQGKSKRRSQVRMEIAEDDRTAGSLGSGETSPLSSGTEAAMSPGLKSTRPEVGQTLRDAANNILGYSGGVVDIPKRDILMSPRETTQKAVSEREKRKSSKDDDLEEEDDDDEELPRRRQGSCGSDTIRPGSLLHGAKRSREQDVGRRQGAGQSYLHRKMSPGSLHRDQMSIWDELTKASRKKLEKSKTKKLPYPRPDISPDHPARDWQKPNEILQALSHIWPLHLARSYRPTVQAPVHPGLFTSEFNLMYVRLLRDKGAGLSGVCREDLQQLLKNSTGTIPSSPVLPPTKKVPPAGASPAKGRQQAARNRH